MDNLEQLEAKYAEMGKEIDRLKFSQPNRRGGDVCAHCYHSNVFFSPVHDSTRLKCHEMLVAKTDVCDKFKEAYPTPLAGRIYRYE